MGALALQASAYKHFSPLLIALALRNPHLTALVVNDTLVPLPQVPPDFFVYADDDEDAIMLLRVALRTCSLTAPRSGCARRHRP